jgi:hypothetical protein
MTRGRGRLAAAAVLALVVSCSAGARHPEPSPPVNSPTQEQAANGIQATRGFRSTRSYQPTPLPVRVDIPSIGVASSLDRLGRAPDRTV